MIKQKLIEILSLNGISILIGIVGGVLGLASPFVDWNSKFNIKWFVALGIFFSFLLIISIKLAFEIYKSRKGSFNSINKVIQFSENDSLFLIENHNNLEFSQRVSIFYNLNGFQVYLADGFVENIQEKFVQIRILSFDEGFQNMYQHEYNRILLNNNNALESILIKNYITYNA